MWFQQIYWFLYITKYKIILAENHYSAIDVFIGPFMSTNLIIGINIITIISIVSIYHFLKDAAAFRVQINELF